MTADSRDTPRVDDKHDELMREYPLKPLPRYIEALSFARQLERELAQARAAAFEDAAKICDAEAEAYRVNGIACEQSGNTVGASSDINGMMGASACAEAIRAAGKDKP